MSTIRAAGAPQPDTNPVAAEASPGYQPTAQPSRADERRRYMERFGARCKTARGAMGIVEAATAIGVHRNTIGNIEKGASLPDVYELERLAEVYGTTTAALLADETHAPATARVAKNTEAVEIDEIVYVPLFDIKVSAGDGHTMFTDPETVLDMRPFPHDYIRRDLGIRHNQIALVTVVGNSMEPELHSRDVALLDLRDREVQSEGTHAIRLDSALLVKKLQRLPNRRLRVISANPAYEPFEIQGSEDADHDFEVLGRVRGGVVIFH